MSNSLPYPVQSRYLVEMHAWKKGLESLERMLRGEMLIPHTSTLCIECHIARLRRRLHALQAKPALQRVSFKKKNTRQYRKKQKVMKPNVIRRQIQRLQCQLKAQS